MAKKYIMAAALAGLMGLAACSGKPADQQAAEDAQKIDLTEIIPQLADDLAAECSRAGIDPACATADKASEVIKASPDFRKAMSVYEDKCPDTYGAKTCAEGYAGFLADAVAARLAGPTAGQAQQNLQQRAAEAAERAAAAKAEAQRLAAEAAAKAKAEAEAAAAKAEEEAKAAADNAKTEAGNAAESAGKSAEGAAKSAAPAVKPAPTAPAPAAAPSGE